MTEVDRDKHPSGIVPVLQNLVATVNLGTPLDLKKIALHARNAEYNPKRFAACIMRIREPKTTALVFASGKMVVTGARSERFAKEAVRLLFLELDKLDTGACKIILMPPSSSTAFITSNRLQSLLEWMFILASRHYPRH